LKLSASRRALLSTASTSWSATWPRKHPSSAHYLGQEIVERIRSRGNVHRHLRQLELDGPVPAPGTELFLEPGKAVGHITSAATLPSAGRTFALAMLRAEAEVGIQTLTYSNGSATGTARLLAATPSFV
jgi:aminomethyltransferase